MVSKFTSRNRTALFRTNSFRWASTYLFLIALIFGGVNDVYAQPTFTQCDPSNVTLQPGGADLVLDNLTIPAFLSLDAVASAGNITYTAFPGMLTCTDIGGGPVTVTITATDENTMGMNTSTCVMNVTVMDGGPAAACMDITRQLTGGTINFIPADFDGGSTACTAVTPLRISDDGGITWYDNTTMLSYNCSDLSMSPFSILLEVEDANANRATCIASLTLEDEVPTPDCKDIMISLDATGNQTIIASDVDNSGFPMPPACSGGLSGLMVSRTSFTCADVSDPPAPIPVTLTYTNFTGQTATCIANVTVMDNTPPMAGCQDITISLAGMSTYSLTPAEITTLTGPSSDNCDLTTMVNPMTFSCADVGSNVMVTVTVTDPAGNSDMCTAMVTVNDDFTPILVDTPMDLTMNSSVVNPMNNNILGDCFATPMFNNPTVTESCTGNLTVSYAPVPGPTAPDIADLPLSGPAVAGATNNSPFPVGQTSVTFTATNASNNALTVSESFVVTIFDDELPSFINCPTNISVNVDPNECDQTVSIVPPTPADNCGAGTLQTIVLVSNPNVILNNTSPGGVLGDPNGVDFADFPVGTTTIIYGYRDASGNQVAPADLCRLTVTVVDNIPPTITCPPNQTLTFGSCNPMATEVPDYTGLSSINDNCPIHPDSIKQFPAAGTPITSIFGPNPVDGQTFNVTITISDTLVLDICPFSVTLDNINVPVPTVNPLATTVLDCGTATINAPTAIDNCGNTIFGIPNQGTPIGNNMYTFTPGNYTVQWSYTDPNNIVITQLQQINVTSDTQAPSIACTDLTLELDENGIAVLSAGSLVGESLQINSGDDGFIGCFLNPPCAEQTEFCITVAAAENIAFNWDYSSFDALGPGGDPFGYSLNGIFVPLTNNNDFTQSGRTEVAVIAGDQFCFSALTVDGGFGRSETSITNFIPGFTGAFDIANWVSNEVTLLFGGTINYTPPNSITDNCGVNFSTLSVNGASTFAFDCTDIGTTPVTVSVLDINGNPGTCTSNITIVDNTAPVLSNIPIAPVMASCSVGADTTGLNVFATDNCSSPSITFNTVTTQTSNPALCSFYNYTVRNIYTATDDQGNQDVQFYDILVSDIDAPVFDAGLATSEMLSVGQNCTATASISLTATDVTDNCAAFSVLDLNYTVRDANGVIIGNGTGNASINLSPGSYSITYSAVDPCGNPSVNFVRSYTVVDDTAPFAICNAGPFTVGLPTSGSITIAGQLINTIDNNSFDNCNPIIRTVTRTDGSPAVFTCADITGQPIDVLLTVTDAVNGSSNSCTSSIIVQDNIAPQIICQNLTVSLDANGQATITPAMVNNGSFDACSALNPASLSLDRTMFDINDVGQTIQVTLSGSDNSGNSSSCTAMISVTPPPTCFQVGQQLGGAGDVISIPVTVSDFVNVASFQFTLEITNTDVADFAGTSGINPAIQTDFLTQLMPTDTFISNIDTMIFMDINGMDSLVIDTTLANSFDQMAVSFVTANIPANLNDNDIAFYIDVLLTGDLNTFSSIIDIPNAIVTPAEIVYEFGNNTANPVLIPTVPCLNPDGPGAFGISQLVIAGQVNNENGLPVNLVDVDLINLAQPLTPVVTDDQTGPDGTYRLIVNATSDYRIIPSKDIRWDNGIDIEDVAAIQRHAVGNVFLNSAYKKIAADVSNDGRVTGFDATLLNNFLSTALLGPPPPTNTSWRFVDADQVLANTPDAFLPAFTETITILNILTDSLSNNFIGVKIGDVAGAIADPQVLNEDGDTREEDLIFTIKDEAVVSGEVYNLTLNARNFEQLIGYQFILNFDPQVLRYIGTETLELDGNAKVGTTLTDQGQLVLTWYNGAPTSEALQAALFDLSFEALRNAGTLQSLLSISELENFKAVAYNEVSEAMDVKLEFVQPVFAKDYQLYQNTPNPFRGETVIGFDLPSETTGTLNIMDVSGKVLKSFADTYQKGYNQITVTASELPSVGVLYYQLKTEDFTATKKMILID